MNHPVTYIGFFQFDSWYSTSVFYPVMNKEGDTYKLSDFPHDDFNYGKILISHRFKSSKAQLSQLPNSPPPNVLMKVTLNTDCFEYDDKDNCYFVLPPEKTDLEIEPISLEELVSEYDFGDDLVPGQWCVKLDSQALKYYGNTAFYFDSFGDFPFVVVNERFRSGEPLKPIPVPREPFKKASTLEKITSLCHFEEASNEQRLFSIPCWTNGHIENRGDGFTEFYELELVKIDTTAPQYAGHLEYDSSAKKYNLIQTGSPDRDEDDDDNEERISSEIVDRIFNYLKDSGRKVSKADVINYCICITQGFITTFAGAPGTGKTSLCRLLAKALGLKEAEEIKVEEIKDNPPRYTEVSVERGWTSLKDFIGYPDPFTTSEKKSSKPAESEGSEADGNPPAEDDDHIIASNIDVYTAFKRMDEETRNESKNCAELPPDLMLLDEANLSPIEYYWSQFLRNCQLDDEDELKKRKIQVARNRAWLLSPNLRFLATVNFDHTTEELSPRFLDRTWVVTLEPPEKIEKGTKPKLPDPVSMEELQDVFGFPKEGETFPTETKKLWENIRAAFSKKEEVDLPLSPRNVNAVENYCIAADRFDNNDINAYQALDLAVLQKILPTISGYGSRYEKLIDELQKEVHQDLPKTAEKLVAMKKEAEQNSNFYQFFIR